MADWVYRSAVRQSGHKRGLFLRFFAFGVGLFVLSGEEISSLMMMLLGVRLNALVSAFTPLNEKEQA